MTSTPARSIRLFVAGVWFLMLIQGIVYIARYALINPYVDEWDFVPLWFHERPAGPWLWELHNEHRFPLARAIYLVLFWTTGDLRVGCYVTFAGLALTAWMLMRTIQRWRGRQHLSDAVFPLLLLHVGQDENLYMGYQLCFMLPALLAACLLRLIVGEHTFRRSFGVALVGGLLLLCGAGGLALAWGVAVWLWVLAFGLDWRRWQRGTLVLLSLVTPLYTMLYFQGYQRPAHHPPSAGIVESLRVALQAESMTFGPVGHALWPAFGWVVVVLGLSAVGLLLWRLRERRERVRGLGLLLYIGASAGVALGIGWGRSGFHDDMGFAWRYGLLLAPTLWGVYVVFLQAGPRCAMGASYGLLMFLLFATPVNSGSGFRDGERLRARERAWEADVRAGLTASEVVAKYQPNCPHWAETLRTFRRHGYAYYAALGEEAP